jgi:Transposase DDE domain
MGLSSTSDGEETAMAESWLSTVAQLTEFFATDQIEASARRTKFVQRASKITGKLFLALITFGRWSVPKTSLAQLAAKAAQLEQPVAVTPEALQQRMNERAVAFLQDLLQTAFTKLHTGDMVCDEALFAPFARVHIADSTGFGLPESLKAQFPGAGGSGSKAGAKIQLVWEYKSHTFDHLALIPWNVPDNKYVDTVVELARPHSLFVFDLGYFKLTAFAQIAAAQAYFLSRLNHQTTLEEVVGGRRQPLDLARSLARQTCPLLEKRVLLGARVQVAARLIAVRMPEAIVNERRRQARVVAKQRGYTPSQAYMTLLAWNLFITNVPATVWLPQTVAIAYSLRWQVDLVFKSWKSHLHLATLTTTTKNSTLCYLYGRMLLILFTYALCPTLRTTVWQKQQREVSLLKLVRHCQAGAELWLQALFQTPLQLSVFLSRACTAAERLVRKAVRKRRTSAQRLRDSLGPQVDFFEPALALAA